MTSSDTRRIGPGRYFHLPTQCMIVRRSEPVEHWEIWRPDQTRAAGTHNTKSEALERLRVLPAGALPPAFQAGSVGAADAPVVRITGLSAILRALDTSAPRPGYVWCLTEVPVAETAR